MVKGVLSEPELKDFLEAKFLQFNTSAFIENDPISIPHFFSKREDIEISSFLIASLSGGKRSSIIKSGRRLIEKMGNTPYDFVLNFNRKDLDVFNNFVHRTFNGEDCKSFLRALQHIYREKGGLYDLFIDCLNVHDLSLGPAISEFRDSFFSIPHTYRTEKHFGDPLRNSAAKRICMFLRWMVREDNKGVDFGIWKRIPSSCLVIPLDIHTGNVARSLGLLKRQQNNWKAAVELTDRLRQFDPQDPVKYDFALFGYGVNEKFN